MCTALGCLALGCLAVSGCAASSSTSTQFGGAHHHGAALAPQASASAGAGFNPTDVAWVQLMIPMDARLLPALDLARHRSADPAVQQLAATVRDDRQSELNQLRALLATSGVPDTDVHAGHDMPGFVTQSELDALQHASGKQFDTLLAQSMRKQFDQSSALARSEQSAGASGAAKALAAAVEQTGTEQVELLGGLGISSAAS